MPDPHSRDSTLPAIATGSTATGQWRGLFVTVIFHPDTSLIGAVCPLFAAGEQRISLGRDNPGFCSDTYPEGIPLKDPHVSRLALSLQNRPDGLRLHRPTGASRCQVDGMPLEGSLLLSPARLGVGVCLQLAHSVVLLLREQTRAEEGAPSVPGEPGLLGGSQALGRLRQEIARAAALDQDVLILGESGSGKEGVARALHRASRRSPGPWVAVNMAAIPPGVAAASLFGSERGAFTGAERRMAGYFQQAQGGTLFLDEVGDTPPEVQPLLLRALQEREIQPVGGAVQSLDLRVVAATDLDLDSAERPFRRSLRYRLSGVEIHVPPLREHPEDIGELLCALLRKACEEADRPCPLASVADDPRRVARWASVFYHCLQYDWPGNVRELQGCARLLSLAPEAGPRLPAMLRSCVPGEVQEPLEHRRAPVPPTDTALAALLERHDYDIAATARSAGISRGALYRRLPALGVRLARDIPDDDVSRALRDHSDDPGAAARALKVSRTALQTRLRGTAWERRDG